MSTGHTYEINDVAFIGRTLREYRSMFDLDLDEWVGESVLDCPSGACAFVAEANDRGIDATGADIAYEAPPGELDLTCEDDIDMAIDGFSGTEDQFTWEFYQDVDGVRNHWADASRTFQTDYRAFPERYLHEELPDLSFEDEEFSLVLSAHLLFLYEDKLSHEFHEQSLLELARVASEQVRLYPLVGFDGRKYERLDELRAMLHEKGYDTEIRTVPFEFQRDANQMLLIDV